jgi:hypothetical protein
MAPELAPIMAPELSPIMAPELSPLGSVSPSLSPAFAPMAEEDSAAVSNRAGVAALVALAAAGLAVLF